MVFVHQFTVGAIDIYADALERVASALMVQDVRAALREIEPISGELWMGRVAVTRTTASERPEPKPRAVSDSTRARVFLRDGFRCSLCGGRGLARSVMVGISDVFPQMFAYDVHYGRGRIHPAYWALALEADHTLPHASGGPGDEGNLTAMHALCNTTKADAYLHEVGEVEQIGSAPGWDGLLSAYPHVVLAGNSHGKRHSAPGYHARWLRRFGLNPLGEETDPAAPPAEVAR